MKKIYVWLFCLAILIAPVLLSSCGDSAEEAAAPEGTPGSVVQPETGQAPEETHMPPSEMTMPDNTEIPGHPETRPGEMNGGPEPEKEGQMEEEAPLPEGGAENSPLAPQMFENGPVPAIVPLDENNILQVSDGDRCPVCAMEVSKYPKFASAISLKDGTTWYFCGTGCMIKSWMHPEIYLGVSRNDLDRPVVREYFTGSPVDAREVNWVAGSDIIGPMGPALVPVQETQVAAFQSRHGGGTVFSLAELNDDKWKEVTGRDMVSARLSE